jgi:predicted acyl esterase
MVVPPTGFWSHLRYLTDKALNRQMLRWFDHWLKGVDTGIMDEPAVAIFDPGTRAWRYENEYPIARTAWTKYYLAGSTSPGAEPGRLQTEPPGEERPDGYRMPDAYAQIAAGKPVLAYATPPLEADLRVWGPLQLNLFAASDRIDTAFFVKVVDVMPDGKAVPVGKGLLKASFRAVDAAKSKPGQPWHPFTRQDLLEPGRVYEFQIEIVPIFRTFKAGHRLQVEIASEDIQYSNPLRQIDVQLLPWPVENSVHHDARHPSHLVLPVVSDAPEIRPVEAPVAEIGWQLVPGAWSPHTNEFPLVDDEGGSA